MKFKLNSPFIPAGDQPKAINSLLRGLQQNRESQVLLGVTGSGKTYTIANIIQKSQRPTLIISHNKTLAGQLYQEFRDFFPNNAVSYFVSYYDYYQPEAYLPSSDTYIEKSTDINEEIDKLRLLATTNLINRNDVIVIASVSSIYNIGDPSNYKKFVITLESGKQYLRKDFLLNLTLLQYERSEYELKRGGFWVKGDTIEIWPAYKDAIIRLEFLGDTLEKMSWLNPISKQLLSPNQLQQEQFDGDKYLLYPSKHFIANPIDNEQAFAEIKRDLNIRIKQLKKLGKDLEAHRLDQKVHYDLDMLMELGYVNGIENYSRYFDGREPGEAPYSLIDYFAKKKDWLLIIDESHITIPQIRGMYNGDRARKQTLIDYGFRLPSALDNRPLKFDEFLRKIPQTIYLSATPGDWEIERPGSTIIEQIIRPTGLVDPEIDIRPTKNQVVNLTEEILKRKTKGQRVLVTTLTKKMSEALTDYLNNPNNFTDIKSKNIQLPKVAYLHSDIDTLDRQDILDDLRSGEYDVLVGINLLREGLDLPEVSLVAILDADKEGFLRSRRSLIQVMGRAARHIDGHVIMYADRITDSMQYAIDEVKRRRKIQLKYNQEHNIVPTSIKKNIKEKLIKRKSVSKSYKTITLKLTPKGKTIDLDQILIDNYDPEDVKKILKQLKKAMFSEARNLHFEKAASIRDKIIEIENRK